MFGYDTMKTVIKAIISDVDGVMVGKQQGVNFPLPDPLVINRIKDLRTKQIPFILCTAKFNFAILEIITKADLQNPHITDGGALIIDPLNHQVIKKHVFPKKLAERIVSACINNHLYIECYGAKDYVIQKNQISMFTEKRIAILQKKHKAVPSLAKHATHVDVIKIIAFADHEQDKRRVEKALHPFIRDIHVVWTIHPSIVPIQICIITIQGVSKQQAASEVLEYLKISPQETLGIGDTMGDWNFMSICKYAATVGNENDELKNLVASKGENNYFYGSSVDDNGILDILTYFFPDR